MNELLQQPEYVHVLINPVLTHALPFAALALLVSVALRSRPAMIVALCIVFLGAATVWPTVHFGQGGYDRMKEVADLTGGERLGAHMHRAESLQWIFYAT